MCLVFIVCRFLFDRKLAEHFNWVGLISVLLDYKMSCQLERLLICLNFKRDYETAESFIMSKLLELENLQITLMRLAFVSPCCCKEFRTHNSENKKIRATNERKKTQKHQ